MTSSSKCRRQLWRSSIMWICRFRHDCRMRSRRKSQETQVSTLFKSLNWRLYICGTWKVSKVQTLNMRQTFLGIIIWVFLRIMSTPRQYSRRKSWTRFMRPVLSSLSIELHNIFVRLFCSRVFVWMIWKCIWRKVQMTRIYSWISCSSSVGSNFTCRPTLLASGTGSVSHNQASKTLYRKAKEISSAT